MKSDKEIFEWIKENKRPEIEMAKCKIIHAYHHYCGDTEKAWKKHTKGLSKLDKNILIEEMQLGSGDERWNDMCEDIESKVENEYHLDIEHEDTDIHIIKFTKNFVIDVYDSLYGWKDKKMSDLEFEIELDGDAYFLVELLKYLNY